MDDLVGNAAVDYKGLLAIRSKTGGWLSNALTVGIEVSERLSTMGIAVNLVTYLIGTMHLPSATSAKIVSDFMGTSFLLCLLGGVIADSFLGRYRTIAIFAIVQTLGTGMLSISTRLPQLQPTPCNVHYSLKSTNCEQATTSQMSVLYISLYLMALGTGGLKSSVSGFCTDQFDETDEKEKAQLTLFFNWFFFFITIGTLLAVTVLVYIQDEVGRSWGYGICSFSILVAVIMFLSGTKRYRYKKTMKSPIAQIIQVLIVAIRKRRLQLPKNDCFLYEDNSDSTRISHTDQFRILDKAAILTKEDYECISSLAQNPWRISSVTKVEEVKMIIRLLPIWTTTILFWTAYAQLVTFSVEQASTMERSIGNFRIPAASLTAFFVSAILISLATYDRLIVPFLKKWTTKSGFTSLQKIGIGLFLSCLGMGVASIIEVKRLSIAKAIEETSHNLPISVFLLIPQFFLVGAGVGFMYTGQLDLFITQSPKGMKTMSTGLFLTTMALGFFFSSLLISIVKKVTTTNINNGWIGESINKGRLDCFYGLLAILIFIDFGFYVLCASWYTSKIIC
ncbi:protein NRT1/ PTR FAMILY 6.2-like [Solanum stenotomum]|uniref:protein NRT1/ PTR FAMILY 6.2-like n=1 Tax=Solanum stenotomum TaxID=172797 RepID=UPI0020D18E0B|nr:protein NRT1/ PTR FAMILY 6.2-like [Solanum stenotomum]